MPPLAVCWCGATVDATALGAVFFGYEGSNPFTSTKMVYTKCMRKYRKYTKEMLDEAAKNASSIMGVLDYLGMARAGGSHTHISKLLKLHDVDTSHFTGRGSNHGKPASNRKQASEILIVLPPGSYRQKTPQLRRALREIGREERCACGIGTEWNGKPITLEVDHIDGDWLNNLEDNLRFICPNCHSQEATSNRPHKYRKS